MKQLESNENQKESSPKPRTAMDEINKDLREARKYNRQAIILSLFSLVMSITALVIRILKTL